MKSKLLIILILSSLVVGCDKSDKNDVSASSTTHYVNTTESISVRTYNGFRLVGNEVIKNKDGSYRVILDIDALFKE